MSNNSPITYDEIVKPRKFSVPASLGKDLDAKINLKEYDEISRADSVDIGVTSPRSERSSSTNRFLNSTGQLQKSNIVHADLKRDKKELNKSDAFEQ